MSDSLRDDQKLDLGTLRNGLGSLQNLERLLKSVRVAPRLLEPAVAAVHADCGPLLVAASALAPALEARGIEPDCARALGAFVIARVEQLQAELGPPRVHGKALPVAARLRLERETTRVTRDLEAALPLIELLDQVTQGRTSSMTVSELMSQYRFEDRPVTRDRERITVRVVPHAGRGEERVAASPRTAMILFSLAVSLLFGEGEREPALEIKLALSDGAAVTTVQQSAGRGERVEIAALPPIEPSLRVARAAAHFAGGSFDFRPAERLVRITWGKPGDVA